MIAWLNLQLWNLLTQRPPSLLLLWWWVISSGVIIHHFCCHFFYTVSPSKACQQVKNTRQGLGTSSGKVESKEQHTHHPRTVSKINHRYLHMAGCMGDSRRVHAQEITRKDKEKDREVPGPLLATTTCTVRTNPLRETSINPFPRLVSSPSSLLHTITMGTMLSKYKYLGGQTTSWTIARAAVSQFGQCVQRHYRVPYGTTSLHHIQGEETRPSQPLDPQN